MIRMADERRFFTYENNYHQLIEFARTCNAEISVVRTSNITIQDLEDLAKSICEQRAGLLAFKGKTALPIPQYEVLEVKIPLTDFLRPRKTQLSRAREISSYIKGRFLESKVVSLRDLEDQFPDLSKSTLCNHVARAKKELRDKGYNFHKVKAGEYVLLTSALNNKDEHASTKKTYSRSKQELGAYKHS